MSCHTVPIWKENSAQKKSTCTQIIRKYFKFFIWQTNDNLPSIFQEFNQGQVEDKTLSFNNWTLYLCQFKRARWRVPGSRRLENLKSFQRTCHWRWRQYISCRVHWKLSTIEPGSVKAIATVNTSEIGKKKLTFKFFVTYWIVEAFLPHNSFRYQRCTNVLILSK